MPVYCFACECGLKGIERILPMDSENPTCPSCGGKMHKVPTFPGMVFMDGEGGYPSRRKFVKGSAPYTTRATKAWGEHDPLDKNIDYMGTRKKDATAPAGGS